MKNALSYILEFDGAEQSETCLLQAGRMCRLNKEYNLISTLDS